MLKDSYINYKIFIASSLKVYRTERSIFVDQLRFVYIDLDENDYQLVAGVTGLEPATSCVTGRRSNQLSYTPTKFNGGR